jgi:hypothetical protein
VRAAPAEADDERPQLRWSPPSSLDGVQAALEIAPSGGHHVLVSTCAQQATQTLVCGSAMATSAPASRRERRDTAAIISGGAPMINGAHAVIFTKDAESLRAFLRDTQSGSPRLTPAGDG